MLTSHHHLLLILSLTFLPSILSNISADRSALLHLQDFVRGRTLRWNATATTPCLWRGVGCDTTTNRVVALRLPSSGLRGQIPPNSIGNLTELRNLSLRGNSLSGELPSDLASCTQLEELHLQGNRFSGEIPASIFTLRNLLRVNLAQNSFSGNLSSGFNNLTKLRNLYLENNQFTGSLPDFESLTDLRKFNVSFNRLSGSVPSRLGKFSGQSFLGTSLCGDPLVSCSSGNEDNKLSGGAIAGIAVGSCIVLLVILIVLFVSWRKYRTKKILPQRSPIRPSPVRLVEHELRNPNPVEGNRLDNNFSSEIITQNHVKHRMVTKKSESDGLVFFGDNVQVFRLQELLRSSAEVLGRGTAGSTYRAYLESGVEVVVKRLKGVCVREEEFRPKIEEVASLVHENLEPVRGYFYGRDEKLLLYEPMSKGSLSELLHGDNKRPLSWEIRVKVALETAHGIEFLHSRSPGTTHGNIKSSNIFLTDYYNARISEFGLTQLISPISILNGYRAPEVTDTRYITQKSDIYSFGVLLLELLSGKEPDNVLTEEGIELPK
ncbi:Mitogen-activated protein kinase (MAPK) kinase MKK3/MKK6 [Handroanthus impetiginosus]|uniref:Mitogen-activated protein kinase (MAPK) kinase MKK3/MKK6 n=1 Tax=Handroanthus impetiginosus TaxID=429701 RepID=A0A2G9H660_9LAMI|nr:Mitogen-activated protein kinase (MAPK) kinase MKK3/MKK6 [Handroanthus impetiginosus]